MRQWADPQWELLLMRSSSPRNSSVTARLGARLLALRRYCWYDCSDRSGSAGGVDLHTRTRPSRLHQLDGEHAAATSQLRAPALRVLFAWGGSV